MNSHPRPEAASARYHATYVGQAFLTDSVVTVTFLAIQFKLPTLQNYSWTIFRRCETQVTQSGLLADEPRRTRDRPKVERSAALSRSCMPLINWFVADKLMPVDGNGESIFSQWPHPSCVLHSRNAGADLRKSLQISNVPMRDSLPQSRLHLLFGIGQARAYLRLGRARGRCLAEKNNSWHKIFYVSCSIFSRRGTIPF